MTTRVGVTILGASGYTGAGLFALCEAHNGVEVRAASSERSAGEALSAVFPRLSGFGDVPLLPANEAVEVDTDVVFLCLPHEAAMDVAPGLLDRGRTVIDLSADFRMDTAEAYEAWYGVEHTAPDLLATKVYGLPEFRRDEIARAKLIAVPGCYPTSVQIPLAPLLSSGMIRPDTIVADSKSGVSGAGRKLSLRTHFVETNENMAPYNVGRVHRHVGEIEQELSKFAEQSARVVFSPHLVPMNQGILSTIYVDLVKPATTDELVALMVAHYDGERFVRVVEHLPETAFVRGTNYADVTAQVVDGSDKAIVICAIDNLIKGAYGQALQCMNVACGFDEGEGLPV